MDQNQRKIIRDAFIWAASDEAKFLLPRVYCQTRDVFQARVNKLIPELQKINQDQNLSFLLAAVAGEVGNNSFDHNLGSWRDAAGVYFNTDLSHRLIVLADRGQGMLATIKKIRPAVQVSKEALKIAFTEIISGRYPEKRGNGLKFVRKVVEENSWELNFYSGNASCLVNHQGIYFKVEKDKIPGVLVIIQF